MIHANIRFGAPDYADWKLTLSAAWSAYRIELGYVDTNVAKSECFGSTGLCSPRAVLTVSGAF